MILYPYLAEIPWALLVHDWILHPTTERRETMSKWLDAIKTVAPIALSLIPGVPPVLIPLIVHGIETAEKLPGATGPQKKAYVIDLVNSGVAGTNAAAGKQVIDPVAVSTAVDEGIDTAVAVANAIASAKKKPVA